jgi:predicted extracellular nuclease
MNKKMILILLAFFLLPIINFGQEKDVQDKDLTIAFYNVENLFDTIDQPGVDDEEFTPGGEKEWNTKRYTKKIYDIAKVLYSMNPDDLPEIIGLSEIENKNVLNDLIKSDLLEKAHYSMVHYNSPDKRGIDVALLFAPAEFTLLKSRSVPISFPFDPATKVRDILYVKGLAKKDTIHIFVNHWKSRYGGKKATEQKRVYSARILKNQTDSIFRKNPQAKIAIVGDFNDEPSDKSLNNTLEASSPAKNTQKQELFNLLYPLDKKGKGTYNYKYEWYMLDNFIVSSSFLNAENGYVIQPGNVHIHKPEWLLFDHPKAGMKIPDRTYGGPNYYGGYSDHLAIYGTFHYKREE